MAITTPTLLAQAKAALQTWPWIPDVEDRHGLPRWMLLAVGSRETNLNPAFAQGRTGDGGHGHGVWQCDDRFHKLPPGFDTDARVQADAAADHLAGLLAHFPGNLKAALAAYNAGAGAVDRQLKQGADPDGATTGHDYGADVASRLAVLTSELPPSSTTGPLVDLTQPTEVLLEMIATDPSNGDYWALTGPEGKVDAYNANGTKGTRFFGDLSDHPEFNAGMGTANGPAVTIAFWAGNGSGSGYVIYTRDPKGGVHPYHFDSTTSKVPAV